MTRAEATGLLRLALSALEREVPNVELARGVLRDVVGSERIEPTEPARSDVNAESFGKFAQRTGYSTRHVRELAKGGRVATIGAGRACRVLVAESLAMLRHGTNTTTETPAEKWAARSGLKLVQ